ncbi:hypothetical protein [Cupriavidus sp. a3]|uniref:hypothetical protein n=1 Tax=Cupriavidus sp. a3 TaxID=3242158 RepID=UPI003D9C296F
MNVERGRALSWSEIEAAPETAGVYAWYSHITISKADIEDAIKRINQAKERGELYARAEVEAIVERFIFSPYRETPYKVSLRGPLKPRFHGEVVHEPAKSDSLIARLVQDPERLKAVSEVLKTAAPWFTAPLYIGMASNLRNRLKQHKAKIVDLRDNWSASGFNEPTEAGFANQIVARNFDPTNLFVHIAEVHVDSGEHNDIENILNRINYPIFGRN